MAKPRREKRPDLGADDALAGAGVPHPQGSRATVVAVVANALSAAATIAGAVVTGSAALAAAAVALVVPTVHQILVLSGGRRVRRALDEEHPFGFGRERYYWSFVVAMLAFALGAVAAVGLGLLAVDDPPAVEEPTWAFAALAVAFALQVLVVRTAARAGDDVRGPSSYRRFIRRARSPELPVVITEGVGALVAIALASAGVGAAVATDEGRWDAYATVAIGGVLAAMTVVQAVAMRGLLIGTSAARRDVETIRAAIEVEPDVLTIIHLKTHHLGPDELLVATKIEFLHELSVAEVAATIDRVERTIRTAVPSARLIYVEPDVHHAHRVSGFVEDHSGHIDPADPRYADITGHRPDGDDDIWTE
jgi:cation diffusion facilitator family transporter